MARAGKRWGERPARGAGTRARVHGPPPSGLLADVLFDPAREHLTGAPPVVSWRDDDDPGFLAEVRRRARGVFTLRRRGQEHGRLAELDPDGLVPPSPRRRRREAQEAQRWCAARPILLPGRAGAAVDAARRAAPSARRLFELLSGPPAARPLLSWLRGAALGPRFRLLNEVATLLDPERDLERAVLASDDGLAPWVKLGRLSTHPADRSLRVRVSFGEEGTDDASDEPLQLRAVAELGSRLLPGASAAEEAVRAELERLLGVPFLLTQPIACWNAPDGGARFHHDAFDDEQADRQRGVASFQLDGETIRALADGPRAALLAELALPGCGRLGALVDRGPEFSTYLADSGHAVVLHPGDVLLLPNHGLSRTAVHSVFSGSARPTYGLSLAIRRRDEGG